MNTTHDPTAQCWRDIADQLTGEQIAELDHWEQHPELPPRTGGQVTPADQRRSVLLRLARNYAASNLAAIRYADIRPPVDAGSTTCWIEWGGGTFARFFSGTSRQVRQLSVDINGVQHADGSVERTIHLFPGEDDDGEMTAGLAREVAAALREAADELDQITVRGQK